MINKTDSNNQLIQTYEGVTRRNFLKYMGLAGATAGLAMTGTGCLYPLLPLPERRKKASWHDISQNYLKIELEEIDKDKLKLTDFILKKDELEGKGIRLARGFEKSIMKEEDLNPLRGKNSHKYPFKRDIPPEFQPKEWIVADYLEQINFPHHRLIILGNEYEAKEECEKMSINFKKGLSKTSKSIGLRIYHNPPFNVVLMSVYLRGDGKKAFLDKNHEQERIERAELYAEKRGLEFVAGTY